MNRRNSANRTFETMERGLFPTFRLSSLVLWWRNRMILPCLGLVALTASSATEFRFPTAKASRAETGLHSGARRPTGASAERSDNPSGRVRIPLIISGTPLRTFFLGSVGCDDSPATAAEANSIARNKSPLPRKNVAKKRSSSSPRRSRSPLEAGVAGRPLSGQGGLPAGIPSDRSGAPTHRAEVIKSRVVLCVTVSE